MLYAKAKYGQKWRRLFGRSAKKVESNKFSNVHFVLILYVHPIIKGYVYSTYDIPITDTSFAIIVPKYRTLERDVALPIFMPPKTAKLVHYRKPTGQKIKANTHVLYISS